MPKCLSPFPSTTFPKLEFWSSPLEVGEHTIDFLRNALFRVRKCSIFRWYYSTSYFIILSLIKSSSTMLFQTLSNDKDLKMIIIIFTIWTMTHHRRLGELYIFWITESCLVLLCIYELLVGLYFIIIYNFMWEYWKPLKLSGFDTSHMMILFSSFDWVMPLHFKCGTPYPYRGIVFCNAVNLC